MPSPIGPIGIEIVGTVVACLRIEPPEPELSAFLPLHRIDGSDFLDEVFGQLSEYFARARRRLDLELGMDLAGVTGLTRRVLHETSRIPYGKTRTYQGVADAVGAPEGGFLMTQAAQVAAILCENPLPILIPCHRVVTDAHRIGDYVAGPERKRWLLDLEQNGAEAV